MNKSRSALRAPFEPTHVATAARRVPWREQLSRCITLLFALTVLALVFLSVGFVLDPFHPYSDPRTGAVLTPPDLLLDKVLHRRPDARSCEMRGLDCPRYVRVSVGEYFAAVDGHNRMVLFRQGQTQPDGQGVALRAFGNDGWRSLCVPGTVSATFGRPAGVAYEKLPPTLRVKLSLGGEAGMQVLAASGARSMDPSCSNTRWLMGHLQSSAWKSLRDEMHRRLPPLAWPDAITIEAVRRAVTLKTGYIVLELAPQGEPLW